MLQVLQQANQIWKPPQNLSISEWADNYRKLSPESSAEAGAWRTSRVPFQKGIMDVFNDPKIEQVVFAKSAQVGATEILLNIIGYYIDQDPAPMLIMQPTLQMAQAFSKANHNAPFKPMRVIAGKHARPSRILIIGMHPYKGRCCTMFWKTAGER